MLVGEALFAAVAIVLVAGGVAKLVDPAPTRVMLSGLGVPRADLSTHLLGGVEVAIGVIAVVLGGAVIAAVVALLFAAMAFVMAFLVVRSDRAGSCGCFGRYSTRPSVVHVVVNALCCAVAFYAMASSVEGVIDYGHHLPVGGAVQAGLVISIAMLLLVAVVGLPGRVGADARNVSPAVRPRRTVDRATEDPRGSGAGARASLQDRRADRQGFRGARPPGG